MGGAGVGASTNQVVVDPDTMADTVEYDHARGKAFYTHEKKQHDCDGWEKDGLQIFAVWEANALLGRPRMQAPIDCICEIPVVPPPKPAPSAPLKRPAAAKPARKEPAPKRHSSGTDKEWVLSEWGRRVMSGWSE